MIYNPVLKAVRNFRTMLLCAIIVAITGVGASAQAAISELQAFDFGHWVVANNNSVQTITVPPSGPYSHTAGLIMISPPQPGRYEVSGLPSNGVVLSINVTMIDPLARGGGNNFTMDNFATSHIGPDVNGILTLRLGARAVSSGDGIPYVDDTYVGEIQVEFNF
jgi:hypothetical protein